MRSARSARARKQTRTNTEAEGRWCEPAFCPADGTGRRSVEPAEAARLAPRPHLSRNPLQGGGVRRSFDSRGRLGTKVPGRATRVPPAGRELATDGFRFHAAARLRVNTRLCVFTRIGLRVFTRNACKHA